MQSAFTKIEVTERLDSKIARFFDLTSSPNDKPFRGTLDGSRFSLVLRAPRSMDSRILVRGEIESTDSGSKVNAEIRGPAIATGVCIFGFLSMVVIFIRNVVADGLTDESGLFVLFMVVFVWSVYSLYRGLIKARLMIADIFASICS